jgi:glycosyltransferase involved in cell wall biosynthesis
MKKMIFINQESGPLMVDIVNKFSQPDLNVILYTGKIIETYSKLNSNVKVRYLSTYKKYNNYVRIFTWTLFFLQTFFFLIVDLRKSTKIYFSSNPPFIYFLMLFFNNKFFVHIYDVYPDALLAFPQINQSSYIYKLFIYFNKKIFIRAEKIFTPSESMKNMLKKYTNKNKIKVVSWWADTNFIKPIKNEKNLFIKKFNLRDKFIVMYSGNLGNTHNIEKILNTARSLVHETKIIFIIIGDGAKKSIVNSFQKKYNLQNLLNLPFQDISMLPHSLTASDISIVLDSMSSKQSISTASIPSKVYYLMAAGSVIYAEADNESELNRLINKYDLGLCDDSIENKNLKTFILNCFQDSDKIKKFKKNSRKASFNFTPENTNILYNEIN